MIVTFCVSFVPACLVSLAIVRAQRLPRERFALAPLALACGTVVVLMALIRAFGLVGWDSAAAGAGCGLGILAGRSLGLTRAQSPG